MVIAERQALGEDFRISGEPKWQKACLPWAALGLKTRHKGGRKTLCRASV